MTAGMVMPLVLTLGIAAGQGGPAAPALAIDAKVDEILTRLEKRSDGLKDIRCKVAYTEEDKINLSRIEKYGQILFLMSKPNPRFLIRFDKTVADDQRGKREWYLFDGQWLNEALERTKQVTRREVARPGEKVDLFDIEKAPFPLPFGQKKEKILGNFTVTLAEKSADDPAGTDHLVCVPNPGSRLARTYDRLDFHILRDLDLPRRIVMTKNNGLEIITADFPDLEAKSINTGVAKKDFAEPGEWKKYKRVIEPLESPDNG